MGNVFVKGEISGRLLRVLDVSGCILTSVVFIKFKMN